jgi:hypothetical protein
MKYLLTVLLLFVSAHVFCQEASYRYSNNTGILSVEVGGRHSRLYVVELYAYKESCGQTCTDCEPCRGDLVKRFYRLEPEMNLRLNVPVGKYLVRAYYTASNYPDILMRCDNLFFVKVDNPGKYFSLVKKYK